MTSSLVVGWRQWRGLLDMANGSCQARWCLCLHARACGLGLGAGFGADLRVAFDAARLAMSSISKEPFV